jgi:uncharacterized protein (DUF1810 family)
MWDLERFVAAQEPVYETVLAELHAGHKSSHWMWFIFPQLAGLGRSEMAHRYALSGLAETRAYLDHPLLGGRLRECCALVLAAGKGVSAHDIFGSPDDVKFRSCVTLFAQAAPAETLFDACLRRFFGGEPDPETLALL